MKRQFSTISSIDVQAPASWQGVFFITLDIDWCHDDILRYSIELLERVNVCATWFVTHDTPMLERLRANPKFELGIHPNFNFLMQGDGRNGRTAEEVIDRLMEVVPEAKSVRSHSLTQSSRLIELFREKGLCYECNSYQPFGLCEPWLTWNDLIKIPHFWEDDLSLEYDVKLHVPDKGLAVFDFHPIHVFLNSGNLAIYEKSADHHYNPEMLKNFRNHSNGVGDWFIELISGAHPCES